MADDTAPSSDYLCPHCGRTILAPVVEEGQATTLSCPGCGETMLIEPSTPDTAGDDELNRARIEQRSRLRRGVYRSRSHAVVLTVVCAVAAVELARQSFLSMRSRAWIWLTFELLLLIVAAIAARYAYRRAMALHLEAQRSRLAGVEAQLEPDFSTLSDGSDRWQKLHDVR